MSKVERPSRPTREIYQPPNARNTKKPASTKNARPKLLKTNSGEEQENNSISNVAEARPKSTYVVTSKARDVSGESENWRKYVSRGQSDERSEMNGGQPSDSHMSPGTSTKRYSQSHHNSSNYQQRNERRRYNNNNNNNGQQQPSDSQQTTVSSKEPGSKRSSNSFKHQNNERNYRENIDRRELKQQQQQNSERSYRENDERWEMKQQNNERNYRGGENNERRENNAQSSNGSQTAPKETGPKRYSLQQKSHLSDPQRNTNQGKQSQLRQNEHKNVSITNHQLETVKQQDNYSSTSTTFGDNIDDFKNISWSEETERAEEEERQKNAIAAAAKNVPQIFDSVAGVSSASTSHRGRGGIILLPPEILDQTKHQQFRDSGKRGRAKGRGQWPRNSGVDPEYSRGTLPLSRAESMKMRYSRGDEPPGAYIGRGYGQGRGRPPVYEYEDTTILQRPGSGGQRQNFTPPSLDKPPTPVNQAEYSNAAKIVDTHMHLINNLSQELKDQYNLAAQHAPFDLDKIVAFRRRLQDEYREAVLVDLMYSYRNNLEHRMWKGAFYETIEMLRSYDSHPPQIRDRMRGCLFHVLDEARQFYEDMKATYEQQYNFKLTDYLRVINENLTNIVQPTVDGLSQTLKYGLLSCQRFEMALGDLERYKEQLKTEPETVNYQCARKHYLYAVQLGPSNGRPYNQLALLAQYTRRKLDVVYYYFRSLSVKHSFETAKDSIKTVFEDQNKKVKLHENQLNSYLESIRRQDAANKRNDNPKRLRREIWYNNMDGSKELDVRNTNDESNSNSPDLDWFKQTPTHDLYRRFLTYFLHLHGMLFAKINMDQFELMAEKCLVQFRELLSRQETPLTPMQLVQIVVICFFSVHHSVTKEQAQKREKNTFSLLQNNAVQLCFSVFGVLLERLLYLYKCNGKRFVFDAHLHLLLPALRLYSTYLCNPDAYKCVSVVGYMTGIDTQGFSVKIWSDLADICNAVEKAKTEKQNFFHLIGIRPVLFPEDYSCSPMFNIFSSKVMAVNIPDKVPENDAIDCARLNSLLELGMYLDGIGSPVLNYDMDTKCYVPTSGALVRSTSPEPIRRRLAASDDEDDYSQRNGVHQEYSDYSVATEESVRLRRQKRDEEEKQKLLESEQCRIVLEITPKYVITDTNSFIEHLNLIRRFYEAKKCRLIWAVPVVVLNELTGLKKHPDSEWVATQAAEALRFIEQCVSESSPTSISRCQAVTIEGNLLPSLQYLTELSSEKVLSNDDRILKCCLKLIEQYDEEHRQNIINLKEESLVFKRSVVLLTDDRNLRVKALAENVPVRTVPHFAKWAKVFE